MELRKPYLTVEIEMDAVSESLVAWRWLLDSAWFPLLVSAVGDVFLINSAGQIARLDTGTGALERISETRGEFEAALNDPTAVADWFLKPVVDELRAQGKKLGHGECYGFSILPIFKEGSYCAENRYCLSAVGHIRFTGDIHRQLKDIIDGEKVRIQVVDRHHGTTSRAPAQRLQEQRVELLQEILRTPSLTDEHTAKQPAAVDPNRAIGPPKAVIGLPRPQARKPARTTQEGVSNNLATGPAIWLMPIKSR